MHSEWIQLLIINELILTSYRLKPSTSRLLDGFFVNVPETLHLSRELRVEEHDTLPLFLCSREAVARAVQGN